MEEINICSADGIQSHKVILIWLRISDAIPPLLCYVMKSVE